MLRNNFIFYRISAFFALNLFISVFIIVFLAYYAIFLRDQTKKIDIDDEFLKKIEDNIRDDNKTSEIIS